MRAAAAISFGASDAAAEGGTWLVEVRGDGSMSTAPVAFAREGSWGPYVLDGVAGVARVTADGRVMGGAAGASPHVLAARVLDTVCPASARGDMRLQVGVTMHEDRPVTQGMVGRYGVVGPGLCPHAIASPSSLFTIGPGGAGWDGHEIAVRRLRHHRCTRLSPPLASHTQGAPP